jgi:signal peptidase
MVGTARKAGSVAVSLLALAMIALVLVPALLGYKRYVVVSGSMTGTYDRGSLVYDEDVPVSQLRIGDVITYTPPASAGAKAPITHRIVWIGRDRAGAPAFRTKGDANKSPDPWRFTLDGARQPRVVFHVPYFGYVLAALAFKAVRLVAIGIPALLVMISVLASLWRDAGEQQRLMRPRLTPR